MDINTYLEEGYFDGNEKPRREIYIDWAKSVAKILDEQKMTAGALRKFFQQVRALENYFQDDSSFEANKHYLYPLRPKVNYDANREQTSVPREFVIFMEQNLNEAEKSRKHFKTFLEHFQSVVAYFPRKK
ncbi:type III-A CRISPR-associated protein Csm2 [Aneurinibacillus sp. UBA3580]|jgi:CRISPR-associated protein Csm2|uniref:type III-A CRISPR-associated protein Csm2 n=1 Tax=Aneurinibacillus sp. UBA3580 TaxID=1946041 RepID=UPI00257F0EBF|nr:type III-A CRISPR-associated protein Csm2 [Aneurinibacillus sp. UBA3580]